METAQSFYQLSADHVLESVEKALQRTEADRRATGSILALNSLENRVYQIEFEDGYQIVAKFYRPNRWTLEQIQEEHSFLRKLEDAEIPVVAPVTAPKSKKTVFTSTNKIHFAVFPKVRGRLLDEFKDTHLQIMGRYVARIHRVGRMVQKTTRRTLDVKTFGWESLGFLAQAPLFESDSVRQQYKDSATRLLTLIEPMFSGVKTHLVHGDCHLGNTLWDGEKPLFLDFDDLCVAPAVQDIWLIVRGRDEPAKKDRETLLQSYEVMHEFDHGELSLVEPLRALRIIHYSAWIAKRWEDPSFPSTFADFGSTRYWYEEISELQKIEDAIRGGGILE